MLKFGALLLFLGQAIFGQTQAGAECAKLLNMIEGFFFASETHNLLHIMLGEEEGDPESAYAEFADQLARHEQNPELVSVTLAFHRLADARRPQNAGADERDALVDYQQLPSNSGTRRSSRPTAILGRYRRPGSSSNRWPDG